MLLIVALLPSALGAQAKKKPPARKTAPAKAAPAPLRTRVAEGRYQLRAKDGDIMQSWDEPWTLYKTKTGYELTETWRASREGATNSLKIDVFMTMAPGLYPTQVRIGPEQSPNQLDCAMTMTEFRCGVGAKQSSLPMEGRYNFFMPSPWLLASIARRAPKRPDQPVAVKLVQVAGMTPEGPSLVAFDAQVSYVGEDLVEVHQAKVPAGIYEIKTADAPTINVWLSADGVVLMMQDSTRPEQRMELVEFTKLAPI
jgi:hypothetical protein